MYNYNQNLLVLIKKRVYCNMPQILAFSFSLNFLKLEFDIEVPYKCSFFGISNHFAYPPIWHPKP